MVSVFLTLILCGNPPTPAKDLNGAIELQSINEESVALIQQKMDTLVSLGAKNITLKINSDGGDVEEGNKLILFLEEKIKAGIQIRCIVDFRARSMAFIVLQSPGCQTRLATVRAMFLAHEPSLEIGGNRAIHNKVIEYLSALAENMASIAGNRLKIGVKGYEEKVKDGDWIFAYNEALAVGAIDGPIDPKDIPYSYKLTSSSDD